MCRSGALATIPAERTKVQAHQRRKEARPKNVVQEQSVPNARLQGMDKEDMEEPLEISFRGQMNDMSLAERESTSQMKVARGHGQRADFVEPDSVLIARCPFEWRREPKLTNEIERSIKTRLFAPQRAHEVRVRGTGRKKRLLALLNAKKR